LTYCRLVALALATLLASCSDQQRTESAVTSATSSVSTTVDAPAARTCTPTLDDGVSPSYRPGAPERSVVGHGHVLTGEVLAARDCSPLRGATVELWPELAGRGHPDEQRATLITDAAGSFRFECDQPEHIHMRVSAPGYHTIGVNTYHPGGAASGTITLVLTSS